jgi:inorganic pyrophosphatase
MPHKSLSPFDNLKPLDAETGDLNVVIETPTGSRNKYAYDEKLGVFVLKGVLAVGHSFPFDFGFIPQTLGGDGDPLDVLVLMDEPAFVGCLVPSRLIESSKPSKPNSTAKSSATTGSLPSPLIRSFTRK